MTTYDIHMDVKYKPLELVDDGGNCLLARVGGRARQRERARLDDYRNAAAPGDEIGEAGA